MELDIQGRSPGKVDDASTKQSSSWLWRIVVLTQAGLVFLVLFSNLSTGTQLSIGVAQIGLMVLVGLVAVRRGIRGLRNYYSPLILSILFIVGFPMRVADIEFAPQRWNIFDYGLFNFSRQAYWEVTAVACFGMCGIVFGQWLAERQGEAKKLAQLRVRNEVSLKRRIYTWAALTLVIALVDMALRIGTLTTTPVALPFRLTGVLNISRAYVLPLIGLWLFGLAVSEGRKRAAAAILALNFVFGLLAVVATLSKGAIIMSLAPYILCLVVNRKRYSVASVLLAGALPFFIVLAPLSVLGANVLRYYSLADQAVPSIDSVVDNGDMSVAIGDMTITERLYKSVILRVVGADLTMGLVMIDKRPLTTLTYMAAIEPHDPRFSEIISDAFLVDLSQHPGEGRATGLFGFWAVSGHWWALFGASMFFGAIAIAAERLFLPFSNIGLSAGVAFQSVILIWEFSFDMMPLFVIALFAVYIVLRYFYYKGNPMATDPQIPLYR